MAKRRSKKRPYPEDEVLDDGTITPVWVERRMPHIPEERRVDMALRLDGYFGSGRFRRINERCEERLVKIRARIAELKATGMTPQEGEKILRAEGILP